LLSPEALFLAQNAPQSVWWPGSARLDPLGELTVLPQTLSWIRGWAPREGGKGRERRGGMM